MRPPALPAFVQLEPVGQCNLRCEMCPIQFRRDGPPYGPPAFMDFALFTRIIDELAGVAELHLQGLGEPMMHPRFFEMVEYAAARGFRVTTNSNMTLLNERRAEACVTSGLDTLHVSIDGASAEMYERIRVRGHFGRVLLNVRRVLTARSGLGADRPRLHMVSVLMKQNLHELPALVRLAAGLEMDELFVQHLAHDFAEATLPAHYAPMRQFVEEQTLLTEDEGRIGEYFGEARLEAARLGLVLRLPPVRAREHPPGTPGPKRCDWPWRGMYFSYEGFAMPCCMVATPDRANFGMLSGHSLSDIWHGPEYTMFRERLNSDSPPDICSSCALYRGTF